MLAKLTKYYSMSEEQLMSKEAESLDGSAYIGGLSMFEEIRYLHGLPLTAPNRRFILPSADIKIV